MLAKLLKHELWATGRTLLPLYGVVLIFGAVTAVTGMTATTHSGGMFPVLVIAGLIFASIAAIIVTFAVICIRFYRNFLGEEGYLSFTLPVSRASLVCSKVTASFIWFLVAILSIVAACAMAISGWGLLSQLGANWGYIGSTLTGIARNIDHGGLIMTLSILAIPVTIASMIVSAYLSMALGQLASSARILLSIVAFVGIMIATQIMITVCIVLAVLIIGPASPTMVAAGMGTMLPTLIAAITVDLIVIVAGFYATTHLLTRRLNLL
ncbi:MAG: hypothetical protein FWE46_03395 [Coriobacteriia bacterium]|nr:hypothetical protein [Coriobacteriia bacterium]MCL2537025.1 hypothetical protein [Coriobacteriia bacterium]